MLLSLSFFSDNLSLMLISILVLIIYNIIYAFGDLNNRLTLIMFEITFFVFLMGKITINLFYKNDFGLNFTDEIMNKILLCLFLSQIFLLIGNVLANINLKKQDTVSDIIIERNINKKTIIEKISKKIYYISCIPCFTVLLDKIIFVQRTGYISYYTSFKTNIPLIILKMGDMFIISFFIFLTTMPTKKEAKIPIYIYIAYSLLSLGYGQRNQFVLNLFIIWIYRFFRNSISNDNEKWMGRKSIFFTIIIIPIMIISLNIIGYTRNEQSTENTNIKSSIIDFFDGQGGSVSLIGYAEKYKEDFPDNKIYTFGALYDFINYNIITNIFYTPPKYKQQTVEMAMYGNSFGQTISYLVMPTNYLNGMGLGTCYIAEVYRDFGYFGVCVINLIYGFILGKIYFMFKKNVFWGTISLIGLKELLFLPRDTCASFITSTFNIINIVTLILIYFTFKICINKSKIQTNIIGKGDIN